MSIELIDENECPLQFVKLYTAKDYKVVPWKNNVGQSLQLVTEPDRSEYHDYYDWAIRIAYLDSSTPLSSYPGYTRHCVQLPKNCTPDPNTTKSVPTKATIELEENKEDNKTPETKIETSDNTAVTPATAAAAAAGAVPSALAPPITVTNNTAEEEKEPIIILRHIDPPKPKEPPKPLKKGAKPEPYKPKPPPEPPVVTEHQLELLKPYSHNGALITSTKHIGPPTMDFNLNTNDETCTATVSVHKLSVGDKSLEFPIAAAVNTVAVFTLQGAVSVGYGDHSTNVKHWNMIRLARREKNDSPTTITATAKSNAVNNEPATFILICWTPQEIPDLAALNRKRLRASNDKPKVETPVVTEPWLATERIIRVAHLQPDEKITKLVFKEGYIDPDDGLDVCPKDYEIKFNFTARIQSNQQVFDTSYKMGKDEKPVSIAHKFKMGIVGIVLSGLYKGIQTMKRGEKALIRIHPDFAYGDYDYAYSQSINIPKSATLEYEVEVCDFYTYQEIDKHGYIGKTILEAGRQGPGEPQEYDTVTILYTAKIYPKGPEFINQTNPAKPIEWVIGTDPSVPQGLQEAIQNMRKGEKSKFFIKPYYAYGQIGGATINKVVIPPTAAIEYIITLVDFKGGDLNPKNAQGYKPEGKIALANQLKEIGNAYFKANKPKQAFQKYSTALTVWNAEVEKKMSGQELKQALEVKIPIWLNQSICKYKTGNYQAAVDKASLVIKHDSDHYKARFKRGQAYYHLDEPELAILDFNVCMKQTNRPNMVDQLKDLNHELALCRTKRANLAKIAKNKFGGFLNKGYELVTDEEEAKLKAIEDAERKKQDEEMKKMYEHDEDDPDKPSPFTQAYINAQNSKVREERERARKMA